MAKGRIKEAATRILSGFLQENGLELYHIEYVKEGRDHYLRVFIDKTGDGETEQYVSIEECEKVSRYLSDGLDEADPVEENYFLEVSSPGLDRELYRDEDYARFAGRMVDVSLYKAIDGEKMITGRLKEKKDGIVALEKEDGREISIPASQISKTKLTVIF